jgi:hypothetical protein
MTSKTQALTMGQQAMCWYCVEDGQVEIARFLDYLGVPHLLFAVGYAATTLWCGSERSVGFRGRFGAGLRGVGSRVYRFDRFQRSLFSL